MEWKNRVTELFGIRYPIIQGALMGFGTSDLAAPISEAGALGMITARTLRTPEKLHEEIKRVKSMTDKPFAVNFSPATDPILQPMLDVVIEEKVPIIETAATRGTELGLRAKEAGLIWMHKATTVRHALAAEREGADAVCIVGLEGVGLKNPTMLTTLVTIPLAVREVKIPVVAAGGIGDARTFLAALALGAEAVLLGTVFCAVKECPISDRVKQALVNADPYDPGWRDPILVTPKIEDLEALKQAKDSKAVMQAIAKAERWADTKRTERSVGMGTASLAVGFIDRMITAKELIDSIIGGAEEILTSGGLGGWKLTPKSSA